MAINKHTHSISYELWNNLTKMQVQHEFTCPENLVRTHVRLLESTGAKNVVSTFIKPVDECIQ